ncbi:MAG TPA: bifunctional phosphoribosylaminoimidazolecarboxamide formyltransferase/IMP cyclohydrolase, partial [Actinomycetales bacterium]|nr:bifunctional phosphoribosylaminoimidazolecarboxamide formyltransferase/IMP cyclohydrolase [Actinomycetales bacterium]
TGFPECLDGRVKTLHPRVHAGVLADRTNPQHVEELSELGVDPFELVVVNLYPFSETVSSGASVAECIEKIDIGGPTMVRAAAKNHGSLAVVVDPDEYGTVLEAVRAGGFTLTQRQRLATQAFRHTASYDVAVATWMGEQYDDDAHPAWRGATWRLGAGLRYGENPHQAAALYLDGTGGLAEAEQLGGKAMSYNNYQDTDAAIRAAHDFDRPAVAIIKHANPCGIAVGESVEEAHARAFACDPVSAFGGVIAANRPVTLAMAEQVKPVFTEVIAAPGYEPDALALLQGKKNLRILKVTPPAVGEAPGPVGTTGNRAAVEVRPVSGGLLVQEVDRIDAAGTREDGSRFGDARENWAHVAGPEADAATLDDLEFAWRAVRAVKSNAILLAKDGASVGVGMGQVNRLDSAKLAVERANTLGAAVTGSQDDVAGGAAGVDSGAVSEERARGAVAASDAFFPFADGLNILVNAGVKAVIAPGGSIRDHEVIAAADAAGVPLYFTGTRHFFH